MMFAIDNRTIDVVYGPPELFFYGATKIILRINTVHEPQEVLDGTKKKVNVFNPDATTFVWTDLDQCLKVVPEISAETFISAMYMSGSSHLKPFPPLQTNYQGSGVFAAAMDTLRRHNGNVIQACQGMVKEWEDAYMRVATGVKHMAVLFKHDIVRPRTYQETERHKKPPNDLHEITGLRLPEELMYYLYLGMIGPRVLNWLISGKVRVLAPYAGGNSDQYRKLVKDQLQPWRMQALALIAYSINRYFQTKEIATSYWFDGEAEQKINIKDLNSAKEIQSTWRVTGDMLNRRSEALSVCFPPFRF